MLGAAPGSLEGAQDALCGRAREAVLMSVRGPQCVRTPIPCAEAGGG